MATPAPVRAFEYYLTLYKRTWRGTAIGSFLNPLFYLAAIGVGLGHFVDQNQTANLGGFTYVVFLAPGLLAFTAMTTAMVESSWPVLAAIKWMRTYFAQAATPLRPREVAGGHFLFVSFRILTASSAFFLVMACFGAVKAWTAVFCVPAALLTGLAFSAPATAFAVSRESDHAFSTIFRFVITPMFLFSGTFFPVTNLPASIRWLAYITPLWHGVALCRGLALGTATSAGVLLHVAVLGAYAGIGLIVADYWYVKKLAA
jgi:lipooligosaccharide transport system permease protein